MVRQQFWKSSRPRPKQPTYVISLSPTNPYGNGECRLFLELNLAEWFHQAKSVRLVNATTALVFIQKKKLSEQSCTLRHPRLAKLNNYCN